MIPVEVSTCTLSSVEEKFFQPNAFMGCAFACDLKKCCKAYKKKGKHCKKCPKRDD